jgi:hypothetical protein
MLGLWMIAAAQVWTFATILAVADAANAGDTIEVWGRTDARECGQAAHADAGCGVNLTITKFR